VQKVQWLVQLLASLATQWVIRSVCLDMFAESKLTGL